MTDLITFTADHFEQPLSFLIIVSILIIVNEKMRIQAIKAILILHSAKSAFYEIISYQYWLKENSYVLQFLRFVGKRRPVLLS